jgi:hypothetical protein
MDKQSKGFLGFNNRNHFVGKKIIKG